MSPAPRWTDRVLADTVRGLPLGGGAVRPADEGQVEALTELLRAIDIAGCGHTTTNADEVRAELSDPDCDWGRGAATVWRGSELVAALIVSDGMAEGRGWRMDAYVRPGDRQGPGIASALVRAGLNEGRDRWRLSGASGVPDPVAKSGCYEGEHALRAELEWQGFVEARRFRRMSIAHFGASDTTQHVGSPALGQGRTTSSGPVTPAGYTLRHVIQSDSDLRAVHAAFVAAFADHFDFVPMTYESWLTHLEGGTEDVTQWLVVEYAGHVVGYIRGSNRYASEECGYVASIGVLREHRGRGLAKALLQARFADDAARGFLLTLLHVDADSPTGARSLYESVGMRTDQEIVAFHRPLLG